MVDRRPPELIFLDLGLPDIDGVELCSVLLRRRLPGTAIVVPREELMREVWGPEWFGDRKTLDVHISALRRRLAAAGLESEQIIAVRGRGYGYVTGV